MPPELWKLLDGLEDDKLGIGSNLLNSTKQALEFGVIAQVAIADYPQLTAFNQRGARLLEHPPGEKVADNLLLMERRIMIM